MNDISIDAGELRHFERVVEMRQHVRKSNTVFKRIVDLEDSIETLVNLRQVIHQYGISTPMMQLVDPGCELVQAGICPAYETLDSNTPVDSIIAQLDAQIEHMRSVKQIALEGFIDKLKKFFIKEVDLMKEYEKDINKALEKFQSISEFDEKAFTEAKTKYSVYTKREFDRIYRCFKRIYPVVSNDVIISSAYDLMKKLKAKNPHIKDEADKALKRIAAVFKPLANDKEVISMFNIRTIITKDGMYDGFMFNNAEYKELNTTKDVDKSGFTIRDLKAYADKAIELTHMVNKIFIDYDYGIVVDFGNAEDELRSIAKEMGVSEVVSVIANLVRDAANVYYFQSVFEPVAELEWRIHQLLMTAIHCEKKSN